MHEITAARAVDVPWLHGSGDALATVRAHLDGAASSFSEAADLARSDAGSAADLLDSAARTARGASAAAESRLGVRSIGERLEPLDGIGDDVIAHVELVGVRQGEHHLRDVLGASYDEMTPDDWQELAKLARRGESTRPAGLHYASSNELAQQIANVATKAETGGTVNTKWGGWRVLNKLRAEARYGTRDEAVNRLRQITLKDHAEVTRQDLHDFDGILQLPADRLPPPLKDWTTQTAAEAAELRGRGSSINHDWWGTFDRVGDRYRWFDADRARSAAHEVVHGSIEDMTEQDWDTLARIAQLPTNRQPLGLLRSDGTTAADLLREGANEFAAGGRPDAKWEGWRVANRVRANLEFPTRTDAVRRLREIVATPNEQLTRAQLHDLDGIAQLPDAIRPVSFRGVENPNWYHQVGEMHGAGRSVKADWSGWTTLDLVRDRVDAPTARKALLGRSYDDMTPGDWRELASMARREDDLSKAGLKHASGNEMATHLDEVADHLEAGRSVNAKWGGWRVLNKLRAGDRYYTREAATTRLEQIAAKEPSELTPQDLHDLDGLMQLPEDLRPTALAEVKDTTFAEGAEVMRRGTGVVTTWSGWRPIDQLHSATKWTTRAAATARAHQLVHSSYEQMSVADWRELAQIAALPSTIRPRGMWIEGAWINDHFRSATQLVKKGEPLNTKWLGFRVINKLRAEANFGTAELAKLRLREIAAKEPRQLTRQDLHDLDGLVQLGDDVRPKALDNVTIESIPEAAELRGARKRINEKWGGWAVYDAAALEARLPRDEAERAEWVREQLRRRMAGEGTERTLSTILRLRPDLIPADMMETGRLAIANELLRDIAEVGATSSQASRPALESAKKALTGWQPEDPAHRQIAKQTMQLIDRNLKRMNQDGFWSTGDGYLDYPDYAEVGRVRSNLDLLEQLDGLARTPAPTPSAAENAIETAVETSPTGEAVTGTTEEVLSW